MMMRLSEVAKAINAELVGDGDFEIVGINHPVAAGPKELALAMENRAIAALPDSKARSAVVLRGQQPQAELAATLYVEHPRYALAGLTSLFAKPVHAPPGVHPLAAVDPTALIAMPTSIGPFVHIGPGALVGPRARILGQVTIGAGAKIGADVLVHEGVRIGERVEIGDRVILHYNACIGADGFSFAMPEIGSPPPPGEPRIKRINSLGTVVLGDDVEVGAVSTIDRGTIEATRIGNGTKIDNHVVIGHNTQIGQECVLAGRVAIAGSVWVGDRVVMGGDVGIIDHMVIGDDAVLMAGAKVISRNVSPGSVMVGTPAVAREKYYEQLRLMHRLKNLFADVDELKTSMAADRRGGDGK
jgi:UDP-3-O-[3-hydroxymyristoyl] glucosamine N-acyltransferase